MLGRLLKYEFKSTAITFVPILLAYLALSFASRLFTFDSPIFAFMIIAGVVQLAYIVISIVITWYPIAIGSKRFRKSLLGDEGYLMNTLPVKASMHILTKVIVSFAWVFLCMISGILSSLIMYLGTDEMDNFVSGMNDFYTSFVEYFSNNPFMTILTILVILTAYLTVLMLTYASISIGHLANSGKKIKTALSFVGFALAGLIIFSLIFQGIDASGSFSTQSEEQQNYVILWTLLSSFIVFCTAFYLITHNVLKKHLNLE